MAITKAELQEKYDALKEDHDFVVAQQESFYNDLIHVAGKAALEHELCDVLEETLKTLNVPVPSVEVIVEQTTIHKMSLLDAYRHAFLDEHTDLVGAVNEAMEFGNLDEGTETVTNVTIKELPLDAKVKADKPRPVSFADLLAA